jgi:hypothetical protein
MKRVKGLGVLVDDLGVLREDLIGGLSLRHIL